MKLLFAALALPCLLLGLAPLHAADNEAKEARMEALRELNDFIGEWKGSGAPDKAKPAANEMWSETLTWGWRFKGDEC